MKSKQLTEHRNQLIYQMYCQLWQKGLREELIWKEIKDQFHLAEATIYRIVLKITKRSNVNELDHVPQSPIDNASN